MKKSVFGNIKASLSSRSFRVGGYSMAAIAIVLAIVVAVNVLMGALPTSVTKLDMSTNKIASLSAQTEKIVKSLDKDVTMYWIVQSGAEDSYLEPMLERYEDLSSHLKVEKIDPDVYPTFAQQYTDNLYNNSFVLECGERTRFVSYTDIYVLDYETYYQTYEETYLFEGENALTNAIHYVVSDDLPKVYTLSGHGEAALNTTFSDAITDENMEIAELSLLTLEAVPEDADLILINAPESDISETEKDMLLSYLSAGGKLLAVTSPPKDGALTNLEAVMESYGVSANEGIVFEGDQNYYIWGESYYLLPEINSHTITDPLIDSGYYILTPFSQGLSIADTLPENVSVTELLTTSAAAYSKVAGYSLTTYDKEDGDIDGPFCLAAAISDSATDAGIVWISSAYVLDETTNYQISGGNLDFFMNCVNWMCEREESISIRSKSLSQEYLTINSGSASTLTAIIVGILPAGYLALGIYLFIRRKRR